MKVSINIFGRFHFFDLAKQLSLKKILFYLHSTYPYFKVKEWGIKKTQYKSIVLFEIIRRIFSKLKLQSGNLDLNLKKLYGYISYYLINKKIDVFIFFAGNCFNSKTILKLKSNRVGCVADEGSAHILSQIKLLEDEYKFLGIQNETIQPKELIDETLLEYDLADYIVVPSTFVKRTFIEQGVKPSKIYVNPYGVDLSSFKEIDKKDEIFRVIYCGSLSIQKGSHYLLEAIYNLKLNDLELWHIGGIEKKILPYIKKFKTNKIIHKGSQPQSDLYKFYSQGNVFILPSIQDGFGMVILQAMACGLPVILSENTGAYDVITKNGEEGFVIPIRSVEAIQEKITYLYNNRDHCKKMGIKAKIRANNGFSWNDYGNRYQQLLKILNREKNEKNV